MLRKLKTWVGLSGRNLLFISLGSAIIAFAMINVHDPSRITEGGILGLSLFLKNVFGLRQTISSPILDILCYGFAISLLGKPFLRASIVATLAYSGFLSLFEFIGPILPSFYHIPWLASILGGLLVGIGCSLVIMQGGAAGGDDALALAISHKLGAKVALVFLAMDFSVLGLSLVYIPIGRLVWSLLTTVVSSVVIGQFEIHVPKPKHVKIPAKPGRIAEVQKS